MILAIDTCLAACSAAIVGEGAAVSRTEVIGTRHAERIAPMVMALLEEAGIVASGLARICVTVGPGSFMGARVGISLAKGLSLPHGKPMVPITTTRAIAISAAAPALVLIDARRGQAYAQWFGRETSDVRIVSYDEARAMAAAAQGRVVGIGLSGVLGGDHPETFPDPRVMAAYAETAEPGRLTPLYLRAPDAKPGRAPL